MGQYALRDLAQAGGTFRMWFSTALAGRNLASWSESAAPDRFEQIAQLIDRFARRLGDTLGADAGPVEPGVIAVAAEAVRS